MKSIRIALGNIEHIKERKSESRLVETLHMTAMLFTGLHTPQTDSILVIGEIKQKKTKKKNDWFLDHGKLFYTWVVRATEG